ncbi:MAG: hypothetical protein ACSHYB_05005 [Roseibacillus sp.]
MELENEESTIPPKESSPNQETPKGFQWNLVGWFGASLGASLWMIATPFFLSWPASGVFAGIVGTLVIWSFSSIVWAFREKISAFKGIVGLLCFTVLSNLGFLLFAHTNKLPLDTAADAIETNYGLYYGALLALVVSLLILFWIKENRAAKS